MRLKVASYNIHKGVGLDRKRDPERILTVLREVDADVIALQEADRRFGKRDAVLPRNLVEDHGWHLAPLRMTATGMGWHGNSILVRKGIEIEDAEAIHLPRLEPRGAVCTRLTLEGRQFYVAGTHLDISGLRRKHQIEAICKHIGGCDAPAVIMGDLNEWSERGGSLRSFADPWRVLSPGRSYPSRRPLAGLDRVVLSPEWELEEAGVHHSALAARASDHLPVWASISLPKK